MLLGRAVALDDRRLLLGGDDAAGACRGPPGCADSSERPTSGLISVRAGDRGDVAEVVLAAVAEAGRLDGDHVDACRAGGSAASVASASPSMSSAMTTRSLDTLQLLLEHRQDVVDGAEIFWSVIRIVRLVDDGLHAVRVGHEVGRDVAAVEGHALDVLDLGLDALGLLDGDDAGPCRRPPSRRRSGRRSRVEAAEIAATCAIWSRVVTVSGVLADLRRRWRASRPRCRASAPSGRRRRPRS